MLYALDVADFGTFFTNMITSVSAIFTAIFNLITGNPLLFGMVAVGVIVPIIFAIYSRIKNS